MTAGPRVSVVVPVRNRRDLLRRLLDGLSAQTYDDFEVIVVDDGSSDGAGDEAASREIAGQPVEVLRTTGVGAVSARGLGVDEARGDVIAFTDSDCVPAREWLAAGVRAIDAGADVVQGRTVPARKPGIRERTVSVPHEEGLYATCNVFYRRAAFEAAGGFDADAGARLGFRPGSRARGLGFGEDTLLGWRVRRRGKAAFEPDALVEHHVFPPDFRDSIRRAWMAGAFPALVREVPELRETLLRRRFLLGKSTRIPIYLAALALPLRPKASAALGAFWLGSHVRRLPRDGRVAPSIKRLAFQLAVDGTTAAALAVGCVRSRTVVL